MVAEVGDKHVAIGGHGDPGGRDELRRQRRAVGEALRAVAGVRRDDPGSSDTADEVVELVADVEIAVRTYCDPPWPVEAGGAAAAVGRAAHAGRAGDRAHRAVGGDAANRVVARVGDVDVAGAVASRRAAG